MYSCPSLLCVKHVSLVLYRLLFFPQQSWAFFGLFSLSFLSSLRQLIQTEPAARHSILRKQSDREKGALELRFAAVATNYDDCVSLPTSQLPVISWQRETIRGRGENSLKKKKWVRNEKKEKKRGHAPASVEGASQEGLI